MLKRSFLCVLTCLIGRTIALAQGPPGGAGATIANATAEQRAAVARMNVELAGLQEALAKARMAVVQASLEVPSKEASIRVAVEAVRAAEQELASTRTNAFAKIQASPNRLTSEQAAAIPATSGARSGAGLNSPTIPHLTAAQGNALLQMTNNMSQLALTLANARTVVSSSSLAQPPDSAKIRANINAVVEAESALAVARAGAFAKLQASANRLDAEQLAAFAALGGVFGQGGFTQPDPLDFNDHRGYVSLFDGVSLKGWDGNPKFWRVEGGSIIGESTPGNPSGNSYLVYRGVDAHDFTLKFEIKVEGDGGSGIQYRSRDGLPWSRPIAANVTANVGPVNLRWMQTGPQADFWPSRIFSGQFYSENTPMGIMAYRGQVVEAAGLGSKRLMANIGELNALGTVIKPNDWNQYTVIARGPTLIHIINGQLMAVLIDDDPGSSNNWTGQFGIEIEVFVKVSARNIWLKKLN